MDSTTSTSIPLAGQFNGITSGDVYNIFDSTVVTKNGKPTQYRLCKKKSGDYVLQGGFVYIRGRKDVWVEWEDLETINE